MSEVIEDSKITNEDVKKPKKRKILKLFTVIVVLLIIAALSLGIIFPGLLWTKSLGISYTEKDYSSMMSKLKYIKDAAPTDGSRDDYAYVYGETTSITTDFTSEEITAFANENRPDYFAAKNVQIRINKDGTIEAVGSVNVDYFLNEVLGDKYSREQISKEVPALGFLPKNVNLYINFDGSVINNKASGEINAAEVQGIPIPSKYVKSNEAISTVTNGLNNLISKNSAKTGSNIEKLAAKDGKVILEGAFPTSLKRQIK